jgi:hypothetical protein
MDLCPKMWHLIILLKNNSCDPVVLVSHTFPPSEVVKRVDSDMLQKIWERNTLSLGHLSSKLAHTEYL